MATRRAIKGVLHNFLGRFTGRSSEYDGYWLLGVLAGDLGGASNRPLAVSIPSVPSEPLIVATELARARFREQMQKVGLPLATVREAGFGCVRGAACAIRLPRLLCLSWPRPLKP